jgi:uncharacterized membrane protein YcaP (DUF421 family)
MHTDCRPAARGSAARKRRFLIGRSALGTPDTLAWFFEMASKQTFRSDSMSGDPLEAFDWQRMFIGDTSPLLLLEIVLRTLIMYVYLLVLTRLVGKRGVGDLNSFDYIIVIAIGSATGDPMFMPELPLAHGMVVITVVVVLERFLAKWIQRSGTLEKMAESTPSPLVRDGEIVWEWLERERMTEGELMSSLRLHGVRDLGEVERAYLEPTGIISVFVYPKGQARQIRSTFPPRHIEEDPL